MLLLPWASRSAFKMGTGQGTCPAALTCRLAHRLQTVLVLLLLELAELRWGCCQLALWTGASTQAQAIYIFVVAERNEELRILQAAFPGPSYSQYRVSDVQTAAWDIMP